MQNSEIVTQITSAIGAHSAWKMKLKAAVSQGNSALNPSEVRCDDNCAFGKWLYGPDLDDTVRAGAPFRVIRRLHAEFHECASRVLVLVEGGSTDEAAALLEGEFTARSEKLVRGMRKWKAESARESIG